MTDLLLTLATYIPPDVIRATLSAPTPLAASARLDPQSDSFLAAVLFADISGFTPLTEALAQRGAEGPEELTRLLNGYFSRMIALIEAQGGEVVKFSGDALTVVFSARQEPLTIATRRALQTAVAMQAAMQDFATLTTSAGPVALGMKIGIGAGEILAMHVGGVSERWEYVIAGDPLRQVALAEHHAARGEIILSPEAQAICSPDPVEPRPLIQPDWTHVQDPEAVAAALRVYVPRVVSTWLAGSLQAWLAVLRPMSVLFISVSGIDYTHPDAVAALHRFLRSTQETVLHYEGSINKLAVDDKGTILLILFGAPPHAHEDDPERALRCALDLQAIVATQGLELAIGVTTGRVFAGPVGGETRREYTVMGDTVNLAARLMSVAGMGQTRCDYETYRAARDRLSFDLLSPVHVKGKAGLVRIYRPIGEVRQEQSTGGALIGRRVELARLMDCLKTIREGHSHVLLIEGEAGVGKSRLVEEMTQAMRERGIVGLKGAGRSIEQQTPYRAWREIFVSYFDLEGIPDVAGRQARVQNHIRDVAPTLEERLPLLNDVLSLNFPETPLTASLSTQLRYESLVSLLLTLLRLWTAEKPLTVVLEDAHWLDTLSWALTLQVARAIKTEQMPLLLVVVMRPQEGESLRLEPQTLSDMPGTERLQLTTLSPEETIALVALRLGVPVSGVPKPLIALVQKRAGGNPFFAEELIYALRDHGHLTITTEDGQTRCSVSQDLEQVEQTLPDTIQGIVLARIDRLPPEEQLAIKVAAVIGRTFAFRALYDTLGEHMEISGRLLQDYLEHLQHLDLTPLEAPEPELTYVFKHIITQEVAYETLLFAQRRQLHRSVALWYEHTLDDGVARPKEKLLESPMAPYSPLLVYHWRQAEDQEREQYYASMAGKWAAAQFANVEAAAYFSRALELTAEMDWETRYDLLMAREAVNDLRGEREVQVQDLINLILLTDELQDERRSAQVILRVSSYKEVVSDYPGALLAAQMAVEHAVRGHDPSGEIEGHIAWGRARWRQGSYEAARPPLMHALAMARVAGHRLSEAQSLQMLGNVYLYQNNYPEAQAHYRQALDIYQAAGNRQGTADNQINLGMSYYELGNYPLARDYYEQALTTFQTTGDRRGETMVLNNLGIVYCDLGDYERARNNHEQALTLRRTIGDLWGEANSLVNLGLVYHGLQDNESSQKSCERALQIQRQIGDRRGQGYSLTYLGHALAGQAKWRAAIEAYEQAAQTRRALGQHSLVMDDLAGLARIGLAQHNLTQAQKSVEDILNWIGANGVGGIEYPVQVYLTCYQVLTAVGQESPAALERAATVLSEAHQILQNQAAGIMDSRLRRMFLENVKFNHDIGVAWETRDHS